MFIAAQCRELIALISAILARTLTIVLVPGAPELPRKLEPEDRPPQVSCRLMDALATLYPLCPDEKPCCQLVRQAPSLCAESPQPSSSTSTASTLTCCRTGLDGIRKTLDQFRAPPVCPHSSPCNFPSLLGWRAFGQR